MEKWDWSEMGRLSQVIKRRRPDAILLYFLNNLYNNHSMITFVPTVVRALLPNTPMVTLFTNVQTTSPGGSGIVAKFIHKALRIVLGKNTHYGFGTLLRDSSRIITMSRQHLQMLVSIFPSAQKKFVIIPPPPIAPLSADTTETRRLGRTQLTVTDSEFLFAYFGYLYPGKGLETLIRAFGIVAVRSSTVRLAVIGSVLQYAGGPEYAAEIKQLITNLGLCEKIVFTGSFDWDSTQGSVYLRAADVCVLPFDAGVQMNNSSFATAAAHGLPIITTYGSLLEDPFIDGENVVLCPPKDAEAMAAAMQRVKDDQQLRSCICKGASCLAEEWFSWASATRRMLTALELDGE